MVQQPSFSEWQQVLDLVKQAVQQEQHEMLLTMLMTPDEREALVARVNIVHELLQGELSAPNKPNAWGRDCNHHAWFE